MLPHLLAVMVLLAPAAVLAQLPPLPSILPPPNGVGILFQLLVPHVARAETPIQLRVTDYIDLAGWMCVAATTEGTKDPFGLEASPIFVTLPGPVSDDEAKRQLCHISALARLTRHLEGIVPEASDLVTFVLNTVTDFTNNGVIANDGSFASGVQACLDAAGKREPFTHAQETHESKLNANLGACLQTEIDAASSTNEMDVLGQAVAALILEYSSGDGWNADGRLARHGECQANCRPFADFTGYRPENMPWFEGDDDDSALRSSPDLFPTHHADDDDDDDDDDDKKRRRDVQSEEFSSFHNDDDDGVCVNHELRWAPLLEDDGLGFFNRQEHVTPHIGLTADLRALSRKSYAKRKAEPPCYDYSEEQRLLLGRLSLLTDAKKAEIEFFDSKLQLAVQIILGAVPHIVGPTVTDRPFTAFAHFLAGYSASEYDSMLTSWKEKRRYDLVRPTTVVQRNGHRLISTYGGLPTGKTRTFPARDFQPYIRTMPHSEYVSGSGCICNAVAEFTDAYLRDNVCVSTIGIEVTVAAGQSRVEPNVTPASDVTLSYASLRAAARACGESRLNGGMHFTASVPAAHAICEGIGLNSRDYTEKLLGGLQIYNTATCSLPPAESIKPEASGFCLNDDDDDK